MLIVNLYLMFARDLLNFHCCLIITMNVGNKILLQRNEIDANYVRIRPWIAKRQKPVQSHSPAGRSRSSKENLGAAGHVVVTLFFQ